MKVTDLTHTIYSDMPVFPGTEQLIFKKANTLEKDGFKEAKFTMYSHTGTHIDAPAHMLSNGPCLSCDIYRGSKMLNIRRAEMCESETLTNIAINSEAYWGYDWIFMESFKSIYRVTEEFINNNPTFVIELDENIIGFYGILSDDKESSLEYLYIEPRNIGKGYGKLLWNHMVDSCRRQNIDEIILVTSPQAKEFYIKMGAIVSGEVDSLVIKGRKVPRLVYRLENKVL